MCTQPLQHAQSASIAAQTVDVYIAGLYATVKMTAVMRVMSSIAVCFFLRTTTVFLFSQLTLHYIYVRVIESGFSRRLLNHYYTRRTELSRKQLGRKLSGKEISFDAVPKNSQRWSRGDIWRQTIPEVASSIVNYIQDVAYKSTPRQTLIFCKWSLWFDCLNQFTCFFFLAGVSWYYIFL